MRSRRTSGISISPRPWALICLEPCRAVTVSRCRVASYLLPPRHTRPHTSLVRTVHFRIYALSRLATRAGVASGSLLHLRELLLSI